MVWPTNDRIYLLMCGGENKWLRCKFVAIDEETKGISFD
jgi:hypothetical protein